MHDRRLDGEVLVFGNQGALFMNAMTWWDHQTGSVWSQPWGRAIRGPLEGRELQLLAFEFVPWRAWIEAHPDTLVLADDFLFRSTRSAGEDFVIGLTLGPEALGVPFRVARAHGVVNTWVGEAPVAITVAPSHAVHVYLRVVEQRVLTLGWSDQELRDLQTGSLWKASTGLASSGPLKGSLLKKLPWITAYEFAWRDFYPHSAWITS